MFFFSLLQLGLITTKERDGTQPAPFSYWEFYKHTQRSFPKGGQQSCAYLLSLLFAHTHTRIGMCVFNYVILMFFNFAYFCLFLVQFASPHSIIFSVRLLPYSFVTKFIQKIFLLCIHFHTTNIRRNTTLNPTPFNCSLTLLYRAFFIILLFFNIFLSLNRV